MVHTNGRSTYDDSVGSACCNMRRSRLVCSGVWEEQKSNFRFHFHLAENRARSVRALLAQYSWESTSHKLEERDWLHGHNTSFYQGEALASNVILYHQLKVHAVLLYLGLQTAWAAEQKKRVVEIGAQVYIHK